ncbi:MAG TPA: hypothetical protein ENN56_00010, partial [Firmicutes bacterium]|nr:hypothetical protein [Bacillota bacterium]
MTDEIIIAPASTWQHILSQPSDAFVAEVARVRAETPAEAKHAIGWYRTLLDGAMKSHQRNPNDDVAFIRAPGRVNLLGTHIDHRGGRVNPIAVRELMLVMFPRTDNRVRIANADASFAPDEFAIADLLPDGPVSDWPDWTLSTPNRLKEQGLLGTWGSYARAACAYMANAWAETDSIRGFDLYVDTQLPPSAGLSSSSALTVGSAIALHVANERTFDRRELAEQ